MAENRAKPQQRLLMMQIILLPTQIVPVTNLRAGLMKKVLNSITVCGKLRIT